MTNHKIGTCEKCGIEHGYDLRVLGLQTYYCRECFEEDLTEIKECKGDESKLCANDMCKSCYYNSYASKEEMLKIRNLGIYKPLRDVPLKTVSYTKEKFVPEIYREKVGGLHFSPLKEEKGKCFICARVGCRVDHDISDKTFDVIRRFREKHGFRCDYSFVDYINMTIKIPILCLYHNLFNNQTPVGHVSGSRECSKCKTEHIRKFLAKKPETFIREAIEKHGKKYDYSLVEYINGRSLVQIKCLKHGIFSQAPESHLQGCGCPECGYERAGRARAETTEGFVIRAMEIHKNKYGYSHVTYINNRIPIVIHCPKHGFFRQIPSNHLKGEGCSKCGRESAGLFHRKSLETFIREATKKHRGKYCYLTAVYINSDTPVQIRCPKHGFFQQAPSNHLSGKGCPECGGCKVKTITEFIEKATRVHDGKYIYTNVEYRNNRTPVHIECPYHGSFSQRPGNHLQGRGCLKCGLLRRTKTTEIFIKEAIRVHKGTYKYSKVIYIHSEAPIQIECPQHGNFSQKPHNHLKGQGCPSCSHKTEAKVTGFLSRLYKICHGFRPNWCRNPKTDHILPFDMNLLEIKLIGEVDGNQHFGVSIWKEYTDEEGIDRDVYKMDKALQQGYSVFRIYQPDAYYDTFDWRTALTNVVKNYDGKPQVFFISKDKTKYLNHKSMIEALGYKTTIVD